MGLRLLGKKGAGDGVMWIFVAAVLLLVAKDFGYIGTQAAAPVGGQTTGGTATQLACAATTVTFENANALARGTDPNEYTRVFLMNGQKKDLGYVAEGGTKSLTGGDKVLAYHAINSTTGTSGYYATKHEFTLPCTGATATYEDTADIYQYDSALSLSYKNQNGQVNTAQAVAANSKYDFDVTIRSSSQMSWGNPELVGKANNALCFKYNNTVITSMNWLVGGTGQSVVAIPQIHSGNNTDNAQNAFKCFAASVIKNTEKLEGVLHIETGSSAGKVDDAINVTTEDMNYDLNADDLSEIVGVQDEDGNDLGTRGDYLTSIDISN